jgi:hypothetical protein
MTERGGIMLDYFAQKLQEMRAADQVDQRADHRIEEMQRREAGFLDEPVSLEEQEMAGIFSKEKEFHTLDRVDTSLLGDEHLLNVSIDNERVYLDEERKFLNELRRGLD